MIWAASKEFNWHFSRAFADVLMRLAVIKCIYYLPSKSCSLRGCNSFPEHAADLMDTYEKLFATYKYHAQCFQHVRAWPAGTKSVPGNIGNTAMLAMVAMSIGKGRPGRRQTPAQLQCETHPQNKQVRGLLKNRSGAMGQMAFKIRLSIAFQRRASATSWPNVQEHIWYLGVFYALWGVRDGLSKRAKGSNGTMHRGVYTW